MNPPAVVRLTAADLPFSCPPPKAEKWNLHPRVFLPLTPAKPEQICPYCGTKYILQNAVRKDSGGAGGGEKAHK